MDVLRAVTLVAYAAAGALCAWLLRYDGAIVLCLVPALGWAIGRRPEAAVLWLAYLLVLSRGLPAGYHSYTGQSLAVGVVLWLVAVLLAASPWLLLWRSSAKGLWMAVCLALTLIPPLGLFGWGHPLFAAAVLGAGWVGVVLIVGLLVSACHWPLARWTVLAFVSVSVFVPTAHSERAVVTAIDTAIGRFDPRDLRSQYPRNLEVQAMLRQRVDAEIVVLPEGMLGLWTQTNAGQWQRAAAGQGKAIYGGAVLIDGRNAIVYIDSNGTEVTYIQQLPVPWVAWNPLITNHQPLGPLPRFRAGAVFLICYEQLLLWPVLTQAIGARGVIAVSDETWAEIDNSLLTYTAVFRRASARLFGGYEVVSRNRGL